jgi:hypothetical protein
MTTVKTKMMTTNHDPVLVVVVDVADSDAKCNRQELEQFENIGLIQTL